MIIIRFTDVITKNSSPNSPCLVILCLSEYLRYVNSDATAVICSLDKLLNKGTSFNVRRIDSDSSFT